MRGPPPGSPSVCRWLWPPPGTCAFRHTEWLSTGAIRATETPSLERRAANPDGVTGLADNSAALLPEHSTGDRFDESARADTRAAALARASIHRLRSSRGR